jgi:hypothetical protein
MAVAIAPMTPDIEDMMLVITSDSEGGVDILCH